MIHAKNKDVITRCQALCFAFGWQGGTIHQIATITGCDSYDLIYGEIESYLNDARSGSSAYSTNSLEFNQNKLLEKSRGNLQFWLGVAQAVQTAIKLKQDTPKKF